MGIALIISGIFLLAVIVFAVFWRSGVFGFWGTILSVGVFIVVFLTSCSIYKATVGVEEREVSCKDIYSIGTHTTVSGNFILGTGSIGTDFVYAYYYRNEDGSFSLHSVKCSDVTIKETNERSPAIVVYKEVFNEEKPNLMFSIGEPLSSHTRTVIYVPVGSVIQTFSLNP